MLITACVIAAGALTCGLLIREVARRRRTATPPQPKANNSTGFPVAIRDVVTISGHEVWLENGWQLKEQDHAFACIFFAREGILIATRAAEATLRWGVPVTLTYGHEPPFTIELGGEQFERVELRPVEIQALEGCAPAPTREALLAEYRAPDETTLTVLTSPDHRSAYRTKQLLDFEFERWGKAE